MKNVTEWGFEEWTIVLFSTLLADIVLKHVAYYVGYGAAIWKVWLFGG